MKFKQKVLLMGPVFLIVLSGSCRKDRNGTETEQEKIISDLQYSGHPLQKMDVYLPAGRSENTPVLFLLHGGAFAAGDKSELSSQCRQFMSAGYAVVNINYRLVDTSGLWKSPPEHKAGEVHISNQLHDIQQAMQLANDQVRSWLVSETKWMMAGHSAGGTLSLLYSYSDLNKDKRIKAAANWAGVLDFSYQDESELQLFDQRLAELFYRISGSEPLNANKDVFKGISPLYQVGQNSVPTINIRPEFNVIFNIPDISKANYDAITVELNSHNIPNKLIEITGADHAFSKPGSWDRVIEETLTFFKSYL